jgi:hypothetical protein
MVPLNSWLSAQYLRLAIRRISFRTRDVDIGAPQSLSKRIHHVIEAAVMPSEILEVRVEGGVEEGAVTVN